MLKKDYSKAMEFAEDTLAKGRHVGANKYIAMGWKLKGDVLIAMEKMEQAAECFEKARDLADKMGYPPLMWTTRSSLGKIYNQQGKYEAAKESLEKAITIIEQMASNVSDTQVGGVFLNSEQIQNVFKQLNAL